MDGAFVVARDGTVEAACRIIDAPNDRPDPPQGPGHPPLGRRRDHQRDQGPGRRRQPVERAPSGSSRKARSSSGSPRCATPAP